MKCHLFSDKVISMMLYLKAHLPDQTYWCAEMMKMLVYLADWESVQEFGHSISPLKWYKRGLNSLEVMGIEGLENWERFIPELSVIRKAFPKKFSSWDLEENELKILRDIITIKKSDDYRIGSFSFRHYVFNTEPLRSKPPLQNPILNPESLENSSPNNQDLITFSDK